MRVPWQVLLGVVLGIGITFGVSLATKGVYRKSDHLYVQAKNENGKDVKNRIQIEHGPNEVMAALGTLSRLDIASITKLLNENQALIGDWRYPLISICLRRMAALEPLDALRNARAFSGPEREQLIHDVFSAWAKANLGGLLKWYSSDGRKEVSKEEASWIFEQAATVDPNEATRFATSFPFGGQRDACIFGVARAFANKNPSKGWDWAMTMSPSMGRNTALQLLGQKIAEIDPASAFELAKTVPTDDTRWVILVQAARVWGQTDAVAAVRSASGLSEYLRDKYTTEVFRGWASVAPESAAEAVSGLPELTQPNASAVVAEQWARTEPALAAQWAEAQPNEKYGSPSLTAVVNSWLASDEEGALNWIASIKDTNKRDYAFAVASSKMSNEFPDLAVSLANTITDLPTRTRALISIRDHLQLIDPAQAKKVDLLIHSDKG